MARFNIFKKQKSNESKMSHDEKYAWDGKDSMICPRCGAEMTKRYSYSAWWCENCHDGLDEDKLDDDDEDDYGESLNVYDAADIWISNGKDEDYMFGYTEEELEDALR